jgi:membrane-bound lytic murein transglycosylase A
MYPHETQTGHLSLQGTRPSASTFAVVLLFAAALAATLPIYPITMSEPRLERLSFDGISGWEHDDLSQAFAAFARSCSEIVKNGRGFTRKVMFGGKRTDWLSVCSDAVALGSQVSAVRAREFFETRFKPFLVHDARWPGGLLTGYFEPEALGDRYRHDDFSVPIYSKPADLVAFDSETEKRLGFRYGRLRGGEPQPYFSRREIEQGALAGRGLEIAWLKSWADAFFIHVQGSGRVKLADGGTLRLAYAAKSGLSYTAIGGVLVERGEIERADMSMQAIRNWMKDNPQKARELMWENKSFVFFREVTVDDPSLGPPGAQQVQLTPLRSLAVDRAFWAFGTPLWIDTELPVVAEGVERSLRRLMIAQDTGSAIKGALRSDVFFGFGEEAARLAGHMKSNGRMIALIPNTLAEQLESNDMQ